MWRGWNVIARRDNRARGTAVAEFALVAPLVFLLVFGMMEGAHLFSVWLTLTNEAREGARLAAVAHGQVDVDDPDDLEVFTCNRVLERARGVLDLDRLSCDLELIHDANGIPVETEVTLRYSVPIITPIVQPVFAPNPVPVAARSTMRVE